MNLLLATLATLRLTRFVTTDWLGHWWIVEPARKWALNAELRAERWEHSEYRARHAAMGRDHPAIPPRPPLPDGEMRSWQAKLVKGLDCPFCVGFWIGAGVLLSLAIARAVPPLLPVWRFVAGVWALNYVTGHISAKMDE